MKVGCVYNFNYYTYHSFGSRNKENYKIGYSDSCSEAVRKSLWDNLNATIFAFQNLSKREDRKTYNNIMDIDNSITSAIKSSSLNGKKNIDIPFAEPIYEGELKNQFRGPSAVNMPEMFKILKEAGIETIVDFSCNPKYEKQIKDNGFEYFGFPIFETSMLQELAMVPKNTFIAQNTRYFDFKNISEHQKERDINRLSKYYDISVKRFIEGQLIPYINIMQKNNIYAGCDFGTSRTDFAMSLNKIFNPKLASFDVKIDDDEKAAFINLYNNLTDEHKKKLGFTKEYEEQLKSVFEIWQQNI